MDYRGVEKFLSVKAKNGLKAAQVPLAVTKWLVSEEGRPLDQCMYHRPEFKGGQQAILSWLNEYNSPAKRLLFESHEQAWNTWLACRPQSALIIVMCPRAALLRSTWTLTRSMMQIGQDIQSILGMKLWRPSKCL